MEIEKRSNEQEQLSHSHVPLIASEILLVLHIMQINSERIIKVFISSWRQNGEGEFNPFRFLSLSSQSWEEN